MAPQNFFEPRAICGRDVAEDDALVRREPQRRAERRADFAEGRLQPHRVGVFDPAVLDVQAVEPRPSPCSCQPMPSLKPWTPTGSQRLERVAEVFFDLVSNRVEAPVVDEVLHAGDFAVGPVAEIALHFDDRDAQIDGPLGVDVAHRQRDGGKRFLRAGRDAEAAADEHVVADDVPVLANRQQAEVVGIDVDAVVARQADRDLEFPRQIGLAVDRLDRIVAGHRAAGRDIAAQCRPRRRSMLSPVSPSVSQIW